mmetsp:Transcript_58990/g.140856  ORF Transcript_58990/g.140856 Transcript_58990/m.140856 type:complete len:873 (-) Transcript_58990:148-2766(-)
MSASPTATEIPGRFENHRNNHVQGHSLHDMVNTDPRRLDQERDVSLKWQRCNHALQQLEAHRRALQSDFSSWLDQLQSAQKECDTMQRCLMPPPSMPPSELSASVFESKVWQQPQALSGTPMFSATEASLPLEQPPRKHLSSMRQNSRHRLADVEKSVSISLPAEVEDRSTDCNSLVLSNISDRDVLQTLRADGKDKVTSPSPGATTTATLRQGWMERSRGTGSDDVLSGRMSRVTSERSVRSHAPSETTMSSNAQVWSQGTGAACIKVKIISARGLPKASGWLARLDTVDPYCQCCVVDKPGSMFQTRVIKSVSDPVWNHEGYISEFYYGDALNFTLWDKDQLTTDDLIGSVNLESESIYPSGFDGELDIKDASGSKKGSLKVKVSFVKQNMAEETPIDMRKKSYGLKTDGKKGPKTNCADRWLHKAVKLLGIPLTDEERHAWQDRLQAAESTPIWQAVHGAYFSTATSLVILVHVVMIGTQADVTLKAELDGESVSDFWDIQSIVFGIWFAVELFIRFLAEGQFFINGPEWRWNFFDFALLCITFMDVVARAALTDYARTLRILRLARLVRIFRLVKVMRAFQSLRLLVNSITGSMVSLLWCLMVLVFIMFMFGIFFLHGTTEYVKTHRDNIAAEVEEMYGSLPDTMITLFQTISGGVDWRDAMDPLTQLEWYYKPSFLVYIFFMYFGVLNVVIGAFVATTADISSKDRQAVVQHEMQRFLEYRENIKAFFIEADKDHSGMLSWDEFEAHLQADEVKAYFQALELDVSQAHIVFKLLDEDGSDQVGLEEFFDGCMRLKGSARSIDVNLLLYENEKQTVKFNDFARSVTQSLASLAEQIRAVQTHWHYEARNVLPDGSINPRLSLRHSDTR